MWLWCSGNRAPNWSASSKQPNHTEGREGDSHTCFVSLLGCFAASSLIYYAACLARMMCYWQEGGERKILIHTGENACKVYDWVGQHFCFCTYFLTVNTKQNTYRRNKQGERGDLPSESHLFSFFGILHCISYESIRNTSYNNNLVDSGSKYQLLSSSLHTK